MKHLLILITLCISTCAYSQDTLTVENLTPKNKIQLTEIYLGQVVNLFNELPKTPLHNEDVPSNKYLRKQWNALNSSTDKNNKVLLERFKSIIPYADKDQLINAILFLQEISLQMKSVE